MTPLTIEALRGCAEALGLAYAEERFGRGLVTRGTPPARDLATWLKSLAPDADVAQWLARAETSGQVEVTLPNGRLVIVAAEHVRAAAFAPASSESARSELVDVAAGVSHELANALSAIHGWARVAVERSTRGGSTTEAVDLVARAARTAERMARHFLVLARGDRVDAAPESDPIDLAELTVDVTRLLEPKGRTNAVRIQVNAAPVWVAGARADALTVLWNLVQNAVEASPHGGTVAVTVSRETVGARVVVTDEGPGIAPEMRERVFDRYFTTKSTGTGLGMALVRDAVARLHGEIVVGAAPRGGASFTVTLPASDPARPSAAPSLPVPATARVLVVDDDEGIRELVRTVLEADGHQVTTAANASQAQAAAEGSDLAIIDVGLDGERGDALADTLREGGRAARVLLMSGDAYQGTMRASPDGWLRKPFDLDALRKAVRRVLRGDG